MKLDESRPREGLKNLRVAAINRNLERKNLWSLLEPNMLN